MILSAEASALLRAATGESTDFCRATFAFFEWFLCSSKGLLIVCLRKVMREALVFCVKTSAEFAGAKGIFLMREY